MDRNKAPEIEVGWGIRSELVPFWIPFWLVGEFTTHFGTYLSGIDWDVHRGYDLIFLKSPWPNGTPPLRKTTLSQASRLFRVLGPNHSQS